MHKTIGAIENGVNIDHIRQGNAWYIVRLLHLKREYPVGIGLNLSSKRMGCKDLVKIENYRLSADEISRISLFAYGATYSEIENYKIIRKLQLTLPKEVLDIIICPNSRCISHHYKSHFYINETANKLIASCHYCNSKYELNQLDKFSL